MRHMGVKPCLLVIIKLEAERIIASQRFVCQLADLICWPTCCILSSNLRGSFVPIVDFAIIAE